MNMKRLIQLAAVALIVAAPVHAVKRYSCDFETEEARSRWVLNPASTPSIYNKLANKWYLGEPGNNDVNGDYGLYISDDGGQSAHYTNKNCWVFAYDTISLDNISGDYTLSFDYTAMGNVAGNFDGLYVFWIPMIDPEENPMTGQHDSIKVLSIPTSDGTIPSDYENYTLRLQPTAGMDYINGTATWRQHTVKIKGSKCDGTPHYLVFGWANGAHMAQQPGGMVDNINITDTLPCEAVTSLTVTPSGTTVSLTWVGTASEYEVLAYSYETGTWAGPKLVQGNQTQFSSLPIGQTDFIVRAKCSDYDYSLKTIVSKLIYYPDLLCVDYLNLDNAVCYTGTGFNSTTSFNNYTQVAPVDYGPSNENSRHTIHFDRNEREPRSAGLLPTIPEGELASIRLGNWLGGNQTERIEFSFNVDTIKYPVLLLKYAPILEAPTHDDDENPRFMLDILIDGHSIGRCGMADFNANDVRGPSGNLTPDAIAQGWHKTPAAQAQANGDDVIWKEWTTVGVNLRHDEYEGKQLTVRLTTFDCAMVQHCGYAYFTLGCSDGKLKGMKCGEINETFEAPDGFNYRWAYASSEKYRNPDGSMPAQYVLGREQIYNAGPQDDSLYVVDCMFVQDSTCFFSLYASTLATNPISVMAQPEIIRNCREGRYTVNFDASQSWVQEIDHVKADTLVSQNYHIESYLWTIEGIEGGWSDEISPSFTFPVEGGDFPVTLRTTCGTCESVIHYNLHLDPLGASRDTITRTLCDDERKSGFVWDEKTKLHIDTAYYDYGLDSVVLFNTVSSCDSIIYLNLVAPVRIYEDTMLLPEELPYTHHGRTYGVDTKTMVDTIPFPGSCDSTWVFNLEIYESLVVVPKTVYVRCEGDGDSLLLEWEIERGRSEAVLYTFDNSAEDTIFNTEKAKGHYAQSIYVGSGIMPNVYSGTLYFVDRKPEFNVKVDYTLTVNYASSVIAQRWNDVLAIRNADYNGGYQFDSVQWYVSGQPIVGATDFNYYTGEGVMLRFGEEYTALLTRRDGVKLFTCPFVPVKVLDTEIPDMPSLVPPSSSLYIKGKGNAVWYDMLGRPYSSMPYDDSDITVPAVAGYYLLVLQADGSRTIHSIMVR